MYRYAAQKQFREASKRENWNRNLADVMLVRRLKVTYGLTLCAMTYVRTVLSGVVMAIANVVIVVVIV